MVDILFLILARSGSKGIPGKNIVQLGDFPMLAYRILMAKKCNFSHEIIVSTDSDHYAEIAKKYGAQVPFIRPEELSKDNSSSNDACLHAINWLEQQGKKYKYLCLLEPTSPFTNIEFIEKALLKMKDSNSKSSVACKYTHPNTFFIQDEEGKGFINQIVQNISHATSTNRQEFKKQITPSGNFYISEIESYKKYQTFYQENTIGYIVPELFALEIDHPIDLEWAKFLLATKKITLEDLGIN
jgi:CMP-N,N'-diacetyllegionaminic acid synthase